MFEQNHELIRSILDCKEIISVKQLKGGCTTDVFKVEYESGIRVIKFQEGEKAYDRFSCEYSSLNILQGIKIIRTPKVYKFERINFNDKEASILVMEYIQLFNPTIEATKLLGEQLAKLHLKDGGKQFGFIRDTYIGENYQPNQWNSSWIEFYKQRLRFQLTLFKSNKLKQYDERIEILVKKTIENLKLFFKDIVEIKPSLLHGDLWAGNWKTDINGNPVIFDPALFFGHWEFDLSIMSMFGDLGIEFYESYFQITKRTPLFFIREKLYQLYHYLNHLNIFGKSYFIGCYSCLSKLSTFIDHEKNLSSND